MRVESAEVVRSVTVGADVYEVQRYRPRVEGGFALIERWRRVADGRVHWRTLSAANVRRTYGKGDQARVTDRATRAGALAAECQIGAQIARFEPREVGRAGFVAEVIGQESQQRRHIALIGFQRVGGEAALVAQMRDPLRKQGRGVHDGDNRPTNR